MGKKRKPSKPGSSRPRRPASGAATDGWDIVEAGAGLLKFLDEAVDRNASAVHIEPVEDGIQVRLRREGQLSIWGVLRRERYDSLVEWYFRRRLKGIQQTVVSDGGALDQETALQALLKIDVDIIYAQEMSQSSAFDDVVRATLNDKLVFTEWHAVDAPHVLVQLSYRNIEPWQICNAVLLVNAQRLLRKLCPECREELAVNERTLFEAGLSQDQTATAHIFRPVGCEACDHTGYQGKVLVCETMAFTPDLKAAFSAGAPSRELKKIAVRGGMSTLRMSGLRKMLAGLTTLDEVLMTTPSDAS